MRLVKTERRRWGRPAFQKEFDFTLTEETFFIAALDEHSRLKWWTMGADPRIIRGESVGPNGELSAQTFYNTQPKLLIAAPDVKEISEIRIFQAAWTDTEFILEQLAALPYPQ